MNKVKALDESPGFIKNVLTEVKHSTAMVTERIDAINQRLSEASTKEQALAVLPVTRIPMDVITEISLTDKEACDAVYKILAGFDRYVSGLKFEACKRNDNVVWMPKDCGHDAIKVMDCELDAETYDKVMSVSCRYNGHPVEFYQFGFSNWMQPKFNSIIKDSDWLKEQGLGTKDKIRWDVSLMFATGHYIVKADSGEAYKVGVLNYKGEVVVPFTDEDKKECMREGYRGYADEMRRRLLAGEKVDEFGRITYCGPAVEDADTNYISREILIDGEAKAVFTSRLEDEHELRFMLELEESDALKERMGDIRGIRYNEEKGVYEVGVMYPDDLFKWKDEVYPERVLGYGVNERLTNYVKAYASQHEVLEKMDIDASRLSNVRIEQRGENRERWLAADIDGEPVVAEKVTDKEWDELQRGATTVVGFALNRYAEYLAHTEAHAEHLHSGVRV